ncbi:hypothetical protein AF72_09565 [Xylella taiwanensis]|nr:hypothetical protein AF72_09565 [Xylella taiwanensis]
MHEAELFNNRNSDTKVAVTQKQTPQHLSPCRQRSRFTNITCLSGADDR